MDARISSVEERILGSSLVADTSIGAGSIIVSDGTEFDDSGTIQLGAEVMPYSSADENTGIITLIGTLASTHTADDPVYVYPLSQERVAYLVAGDDPKDEEGMAARIPHALWDKIPVGIRDWTVGEGETVQADFLGDELVIMELTGQDPIVDASFIDVTTLPPTPSDGNPPASSPTPTVQGGVGFLAVKWDAITNADQVTYDVHLSTSTGFTPGPTTLAGTTNGTIIFLRLDANDVELVYDTDYYIKLIARDVDGSAAASAEVGPVRLDPAGAADILAGAITAEKLESVLVLATTLATAVNGSRVEVTAADGITLYDAANNVLVSLPVDGSDPTFRGNVITGGLTVLGNMLIQGSDNHMDKGSVLTLNEGLGDPSTAPIVSYGYESYAFPNDLDNLVAGFAWNTATSKFYSVQNFAGDPKTLVECSISGSVISTLRTKNLSTDMTDASYIVGVGIIGTDVWIGYISATAKLKAAKYDLSTLTFQTSVTLINSTVETGGGPAFSADGTNMIYANWSGTGGSATVQIRTFNTSGTQLSSNNTTSGLTRGTGVPRVPFIRGISTDGTDYWIQTVVFNASGTILGTYVEQYNASTYAHVSNKDTYIKKGTLTTCTGIAWDGAHMRLLAGYGVVNGTVYMTTLGDLLWNDGTGDIWYVAYEWADATPHLTLPSPLGSASAANTGTYTVPMRRGRVTITNPSLPSTVTAVRIFADHGSSPPASSALNRQTVSTYIDTESGTTHIMKNFDTGGSAPDTSNTFPGGTSTVIGTGSAITSPWELGGDGKQRLSNIAVSARLAGPETGDIAYDADAQAPNFYGQAAAGLWAPIASRMAIAPRTFEYFTDLLGAYDDTAAIDKVADWVVFGNNGGSAASLASVSKHPGILQLATGTTSNATGNAGIRTFSTAFMLGDGVVRYSCLLRTPATITTPFVYITAGLTDSSTADPTLGYYFRWNNNVNSNKWQRAVATTFTDTGFTAVVAATWYRLDIVVNAAATSAEFFINGASVGTSSGSAQTGSAVMAMTATRKDTSTATSRATWVDYIGVAGEFSADRL